MKAILLFKIENNNIIHGQLHSLFNSINKVAILLINYKKLKDKYNKVTIYTNEYGYITLKEFFDVDVKDVVLLNTNIKNFSSDIIDQFYICSQQSEEFIFINSNVIYNHFIDPLPGSNFYYYTNENICFSYVNWQNLLLKFNDATNYQSINSYFHCYNLDICGGKDSNFWKFFFNLINEKILNHDIFFELSEDELKFFICTYLFEYFTVIQNKKVSPLFTDDTRTANLKSTNDLFKLYYNRPIINIPLRILKYNHTYKFLKKYINVLSDSIYDSFNIYSKKQFIIFNQSNLQNILNVNDKYRITFEVIHKYDLKTYEKYKTKKIPNNIIKDIVRNQLCDTKYKQILKDVYKYEATKSFLFDDCTKQFSAKDRYYGNEKCNIDQYLRSNSSLKMSYLCSIVKTKWDWIIPIDIEKLYSLKVFYNSTTESNLFSTMFLYDEITSKIDEIRLDELNLKILNVFKKPTNLNDALNKIIISFNKKELINNFETIKNIVIKRIEDLLNIKALELLIKQ